MRDDNESPQAPGAVDLEAVQKLVIAAHSVDGCAMLKDNAGECPLCKALGLLALRSLRPVPAPEGEADPKRQLAEIHGKYEALVCDMVAEKDKRLHAEAKVESLEAALRDETAKVEKLDGICRFSEKTTADLMKYAEGLEAKAREASPGAPAVPKCAECGSQRMELSCLDCADNLLAETQSKLDGIILRPAESGAPAGVVEADAEALRKPIRWMGEWVRAADCDCEDGHRCGLPERAKECAEAEQVWERLFSMPKVRRALAALQPVPQEVGKPWIPPKKDCDLCRGTGFYGDNGPGRKGNSEFVPCDCTAPQEGRKGNDHG